MKSQNNFVTGMHYFSEGARLLWHPKLRAFILIPLLVNGLLFLGLSIYFFSLIGDLADGTQAFIPESLSWLAPLAWVVWALLAVLIIIVYGYSFNLITNIIAGPFYGVLAEKTEELLTGIKPDSEPLASMVVRVVFRELAKLFYFLTRGLFIVLVVLLLGTIPLLQIIAPLVGLAWGAWSMSIQYGDYPADNHRLEFKEVRRRLGKRMYSCFGFGGMVMVASMIPIVNIFAMPAAVTGGTLFWINELHRSD